MDGVASVRVVDPDAFRADLDAVRKTLDVSAVVVGMLGDAAIAREAMLWMHAFYGPVILDPVLASSGGSLLDDAGRVLLRDLLVPRALMVCPNLDELAWLSGVGRPAADEASRIEQAERVLDRGCACVVAKGGHSGGAESVDLFVDDAGVERLVAPRVPGVFRGTGGAFAAAAAAACARGMDARAAARFAHGVVAAALRDASAAGTPMLALKDAPPSP
jgi:hydroxymethylpyrimidine/phosphomethylpyrimidine kinase